MDVPDVRYTRAGDVAIAYQVVGDGPRGLIFVRGFPRRPVGILGPAALREARGAACGVSRVILFDKRGSGLSDPVRQLPTLEARMDDVRAVLDEVGAEAAAIRTAHEGTLLAAEADVGGVLATGTVKDLVAGSGIEFDDRGEHELKGVPGTWRLYAVVDG